MTTAADRHTTGLTDLLATLVDLKSWLREIAHWHETEQATATMTTLSVLDRCGPSRVGRLAEVLRVDMSVVSRHATALEKAGLLVREVDPTDGRAHQLVITPAGQDALAQGRARIADVVSQRLLGWTDDEIVRLNAGLRRLLTDLTADRSH